MSSAIILTNKVKLLDEQGLPWRVVKEDTGSQVYLKVWPQPVPQFPLMATDLTAEPQACSCVINDTNIAPVCGDPVVTDTGQEGVRYFLTSSSAVLAEAKG